jgi:hypothetical protein
VLAVQFFTSHFVGTETTTNVVKMEKLQGEQGKKNYKGEKAVSLWFGFLDRVPQCDDTAEEEGPPLQRNRKQHRRNDHHQNPSLF